MESIYYVICWACHRRCTHCYEERFRPYVRDELASVVAEAERCFPAIIDHLPERLTYADLAEPLPAGGYAEKRGRVILAGGEVLVDPVRDRVLYPVMDRLRQKYAGQGGVELIIQTTGDLVTERIIDELLTHGATSISVSGMDDFHVGLEGEKRDPLQQRLIRWFEAAGMVPTGHKPGTPRRPGEAEAATYGFFGATPDHWIGKLWPRGRAWSNGLSTAGIQDNFCNAWSGGLNFLNQQHSGSEVSIEPDGNVYPCCMKTKRPIGNLVEEPLQEILDSLIGHPVYEAITSGHPERMGLAYGWDVHRFLAESETRTAKGDAYRNLCIGCDRFHEKVLGPVIDEMTARRRAARIAKAA